MKGIIRPDGRPVKIKVKLIVKGLPVAAEVRVTDMMVQPGKVVTGWVPHVTEIPWSSGVAG